MSRPSIVAFTDLADATANAVNLAIVDRNQVGVSLDPLAPSAAIGTTTGIWQEPPPSW